MVAAPTVIAALAVAGEGASEIAASKCGHALSKVRIAVHTADLVHGRLECPHALAKFSEKVGVRSCQDGAAARNVRLSAVQIVAANRAEENLALHAKSVVGGTGRPVTRLDQSSNHLELSAETGIEFSATDRIGYFEIIRLVWKGHGPELQTARWILRSIRGIVDCAVQ